MVDEIKSNLSLETSKMIMSDVEITAGAIFLMLAGLETTSSLLSSCSIALSFHPQVQKKLYDELLIIVEFRNGKALFNYEKLTSCAYLDEVLAKTLRRITPIPSIDREASREYKIEKINLTISKGGVINLALYAINNDPEYWQEPEKFNPERFMPGNKENIVPGSYCPFGIGPRHCIGMRFSLTEVKIGLAKILLNFRFEPALGTNFPLKMAANPFIFNFKDPRVALVARFT